MSLIYNLKDKYYRYKENKRYKIVKNCNLPYPFHDDKRWTFEWVWFDKNSRLYNVERLLSYSFPQRGLIYHYEAKMFSLKTGVYELMSTHTHSFDEVLEALYEYPESFNIQDKDKCEYSEQELEFIKENQNYFKLIGLKDYRKSDSLIKLDEKYQRLDKKKHKNLNDKYFLLTYNHKFKKIREKENIERYKNAKHEKYGEAITRHWDNDVVEATLNGKKKTVLKRKYPFTKSLIGTKYLLVDENLEFKALIEFVKEVTINFNELVEKDIYIPQKYKNFKEYKDFLKKDYEEEGIIFNEKFTEDSEIICGYFKVIERI